ncbi:cell wall hydrolase [Methylobacterium sp. W2]|uniref:cell wall hydrolase n=1 Tax=Methylobacterium sp. W2 TaxID=2598107 RepID=UPI001D0C39DC|nr:cell wall hydrolase [Methylobacterium sp. W2]MCC0805618.1 cell wall hydrolase [Methylobacterium sp. W2]
MGYPQSATTGLYGVLLMTTMGLGACNSPTTTGSLGGPGLAARPMAVSDEERDCLGRAMYFESNRSDSEGLLAVGTVVMNRLEAAAFPNGGICAVVGQPRQFATGVLTKPMAEKDLTKVADAADAVLAGQRHPKVGRAMYFHTAGRTFHYNNMHYVAVAGGNAFYEKRKPGAVEQARPPAALAFAAASTPSIPETAPVQVVANSAPAGIPSTPPVAALPDVTGTQPASTALAEPDRAVAASRAAVGQDARFKASSKAVARTRVAHAKSPATLAALAPEAPPPPPIINLPRP